ncbi:MAG: MFS transporter [Rhodobiaceae bacterium]|nr:MFS transporter [Rhodobiaceae bacterium]
MQNLLRDWRSPTLLLMIMTAAMQLSFAVWWTVVKNFAVDDIGLTGADIGLQESIREIPGFMAFLAIYLVLFMRQQTLAVVSLLLLGGGVAATGFFPTLTGLFVTTFLMSLGFHYFATMSDALQLQWLPKATAPAIMGRIVAVAAGAQLAAYGIIFVTWHTLNLTYQIVFGVAGGVTLVITAFAMLAFPQYNVGPAQGKSPVLRRRYWLYYALTFFSGARRQIFVVFAILLMVQRFEYDVEHVALLFLINGALNLVFAPVIGRMIVRWGERRALTLEYVGLVLLFIAYAFVSDPIVAAVLFIIDHAFFAMAIAMKTYFQKIADPADIAPTAGVAFTINHIAAVFIPALFGLLWLVSPSAVFLSGAAMAACSLVLARMVPEAPEPGNEVIRQLARQPAE